MKKILIDTNIYSKAMRGEKSSIQIFRQHETLLISPIVIGELLAGFKRGKLEEKNRKQLKEFLNRERVQSLFISKETSEFYSFILNNLKTKGTPIPINDIWIGASAMEHGAGLATVDNHFENIEGVIIVKPE